MQNEGIKADSDTLRLMLLDARTHYGWQDKQVTMSTLRRLYDLAKMGPTSMNQQPMRVLFVQSQDAKERLRPCLIEGNIAKMMAAPVTAIIAYDLNFFEELPRLFPPNLNAKDIFKKNATAAQINAFRNGTLQGAYFMLAARAVGLDIGGMSGFDNTKVDEAFFQGSSLKSNFLCNLGYADTSRIFRRLPRLEFDEACELLGELPA
ncbi:MAG: malonic semialdehyde reductase [Hyphomicrobiaceae bacterium]